MKEEEGSFSDGGVMSSLGFGSPTCRNGTNSYSERLIISGSILEQISSKSGRALGSSAQHD